jgi:hypothetical protein
MALTAQVADPIEGDKLYQQRARKALPLLVRQALAGEQIFYSDLAEELGMKNARNLNYVLGSIGQTMQRLGKAWAEPVPPIQFLVVNKSTGLPGDGIEWFVTNLADYGKLPSAKQREIVKAELVKIFSYPKWPAVLAALSLPYTPPDFTPLIEEAIRFGGGEGEAHKRLKEFVARHPEVIGLPPNTPAGNIEQPLPSGDSLDVCFQETQEWTAAEVKPIDSPIGDILRGLFQCVKYKAVMEAEQVTKGLTRAATAVLVLQGTLPHVLVPIRNMLGITVFEGVVPAQV